MPGIDGVQLMERLRPKQPAMRVLLVSGHANRPGTEPGKLPESAAFLQKPFGPDEFLEKVNEVLQRTVPALPN